MALRYCSLVIALHVVCVEIGTCGMCLVCLLLELTGLKRFVGASYGTQQQVNRCVEEAIVAYRRAERARLAHAMPLAVALAECSLKLSQSRYQSSKRNHLG